jgi:hypothetical protein
VGLQQHKRSRKDLGYADMVYRMMWILKHKVKKDMVCRTMHILFLKLYMVVD